MHFRFPGYIPFADKRAPELEQKPPPPRAGMLAGRKAQPGRKPNGSAAPPPTAARHWRSRNGSGWKGFGCRRWRPSLQGAGPAFESRQGRNPRGEFAEGRGGPMAI